MFQPIYNSRAKSVRSRPGNPTEAHRERVQAVNATATSRKQITVPTFCILTFHAQQLSILVLRLCLDYHVSLPRPDPQPQVMAQTPHARPEQAQPLPNTQRRPPTHNRHRNPPKQRRRKHNPHNRLPRSPALRALAGSHPARQVPQNHALRSPRHMRLCVTLLSRDILRWKSTAEQR